MNRPGFRQRLIAFGRVANAGVHNLFRNAWLTTAAIAVMVVTLTIIQFGFITYAALNDTIDDRSRDLTVSIYLNDVDDETALVPLENELSDNNSVESLVFKSKGEALRDFQDNFGDEPELLEGIGLTDENPLPASFEVVLSDISEFQSVIDIAEDERYEEIVDSAEFSDLKQNSFNAFINLRKFFARGSVIAGLVFGLISVLIIFNTIRMAIFTRRDEVEIMKLIGATPAYIKGPFLFEASLYGFIAAILSLVAMYSTVFAVYPIVRSSLEFEQTFRYLNDNWFMVSFAVISAGILLGFISSSVALSRYLRLKKW